MPDIYSRYCPQTRVLGTDRLALSRLADEDSDTGDQFVALVARIIGASYSEITVGFARNIREIDSRGFDKFGYFSLGKEVWVARRVDSGKLVGFEVVTRKRGGSIKLGPTVILTEHQGRGYATELIQALLGLYEQAGARKVYVTAPLLDEATAALDSKYLAFRPEALLRAQYGRGRDERVFGRMLRPEVYRGISARVALHEGENGVVEVIRGLGALSEERFSSMVLSEMERAYDDIEEGFVRAILSAHGRKMSRAYESLEYEGQLNNL